MRAPSVISLALGVASAVQGLVARRDVQRIEDVARFSLQNFLISDVYTYSFVDPETTYNRGISFLFSDPNSNTSTICTASWTQSNYTNTAPFSYALCDYTGNEEAFEWYFTSYISLQRFSIAFSHGWDDPADFPPPWEYIGMFSEVNSFNLTCVSGNSLHGCFLPLAQSPYRAMINALTN